jgi:uncharacterized protein (TIRG00374 family)
LGIFILALLIWYIDPISLLTELSKVSPERLILPTLSFFLAYLLRAIRWKILLNPVKKSVKIANTFWTTMVGFMVNLIIPLRLGGEFARAYIIDKKENVGFFEALSSIIVERVLDLLGITLLGLIAIFSLPSDVEFPLWFSDSIKMIGIISLALFVSIIIFARSTKKRIKLVNFLISIRFIPHRWRLKIRDIIESTAKGCEGVVNNPLVLLKVIILTPLVWLSFYLSFYFMFNAFNYNISPSILLLAVMLLQLTFIFPATPGFVGTYEAYWSIIFIGLTGLSNLDAILIAIGVMSHLVNNLLIIILGFIGTMTLGFSMSNVIKMGYKKNVKNNS